MDFPGFFPVALVAFEFMEATEMVLSDGLYLPFFFNWLTGFATGARGINSFSAVFYSAIGSLWTLILSSSSPNNGSSNLLLVADCLVLLALVATIFLCLGSLRIPLLYF